jgi:hypothetical protein
MTVAILIIVCFIAFYGGFLAGSISDTALPPKNRKSRAEIEKLQKEFKNFLEYDGSEQE